MMRWNLVIVFTALSCSSAKQIDMNFGKEAGRDFEVPVREVGTTGDAAQDASVSFDPAACQACEMAAPDSCAPALLVVPGQTGWGCAGFTGAALSACVNLLGCIRGQVRGVCRNGGDPTPCLCGTLSQAECATSGAPTTSLCFAEYNAAAMGANLFTQFNDPATPVGIANNLLTCDVGSNCTTACGVQ